MILSLNRLFVKCMIILAFCLGQHLLLCQHLFAQESAPQAVEPSKNDPATAQVNKTERAPTPNKAQQNQRLLRGELSHHDVVTMSAMGEEFLGIWEQDSTGNPFGAAIIVHGAGQTADWPNTITSLRQELANHGWATLSVSLPETSEPLIPPRPTNTPPAIKTKDKPKTSAEQTKSNQLNSTGDNAIPQTANEQNNGNNPQTPLPALSSVKKDTESEIEAKVHARLKAAIAFLNQQGQFNIVLIGNGLGAGRAARFIDTLSNSGANAPSGPKMGTGRNKSIITRPIRALVMISARNAIPNTTKTLGEFLSDPGLPVLDVLFNEHYLDEIESNQRKQLARKMRLQQFFQVKLLAPTGELDASTNRLVRRVRGFLNRYAKGVEIAN